jgi:hypothetical protein
MENSLLEVESDSSPCETDWLQDMSPNDEKPLDALRKRVDRIETQLANAIEPKLDGIANLLIKIENDLKWHRIFGSGIAAMFGVVLAWLLIYHIPNAIHDKISPVDEKIPTDFKERFGKMGADIQNMQEQLNRITPTSLNGLIPDPSKKVRPMVISEQLRQASRLIDFAMTSRIAAEPKSLTPLLMRVDAIRQKYKGDSQIQSAADGADVRLSAYKSASKDILNGVAPVTTQNGTQPLDMRQNHGFFNIDITCLHPANTLFLGVPFTPDAVNVYVVKVHVVGCGQLLDGPRWINDSFTGSTIYYDGGPLSLADVSFKNCTFEFANSPHKDFVLSALRASNGKPVTLLVPFP